MQSSTLTKGTGPVLNLTDTAQLNRSRDLAKFRKLTATQKKHLRSLHAEGKKPEEIAVAMELPLRRIQTAIRYHVHGVGKNGPLQRATTEALADELMRRGKKLNVGDKLAWAFIILVGLVIGWVAIRTLVHV